MKKLTYLFASLIMVALIVSCSKDTTNDDDAMLKKAVATGPSAPDSDGGITPYIISGANNGGNRTCAEVAAWKGLSANYFYCVDKVDYNNGAFASAFPSGLDVTVTGGKFVSFEMDNCIKFGGKFYKVGAVIVKGSNAANVYYYPDGTKGDSGLASPINASGSPAGLSNLTFCFIECEQHSQLVIAVKASYWLSYSSYQNSVWGDLRYTCSTGSLVYPPSEIECNVVGINYYPGTSSFPLLDNVGTVGIVEGINSLIITVDLNEGFVWNQTSLYVGSLAGLGDLTSCPTVMSWPYQNDTKQNTHVFTIPY